MTHQTFSPPYPVVVIHHGFIAQMPHHPFNAQVFAEAGYMAIVVNGVHPVTGAPNVQDSANGGEVLNWLAYRQAIAQDAFDRLIALKFPAGSIDKYRVSQGFYDPVQLLSSGDPLYGGNVPYKVEGLWTTDRFAQEFRSFCSIFVPDYIGGSDGSPGSATAARADSGADGDMRFTGCPQV